MKKITLYTSLSLTLVLSVMIVLVDFMYYDFCAYSCQRLIINVGEAFLFFPVVLLFSLITYFAPERVFASWWKFARIAIPIIFTLALIINLELHHSPVGEMQDIFDVPALVLLYSIFTIGSVRQIWKGWKST